MTELIRQLGIDWRLVVLNLVAFVLIVAALVLVIVRAAGRKRD